MSLWLIYVQAGRYPAAHATLGRVVFGFKIFGQRSGLIEVDVDALANAAAMKVILLPLFFFRFEFDR